MSILNKSSSRTTYRGYEYYKSKQVIDCIQTTDYEYEGFVQGSNKSPYFVTINTLHPMKSTCECPFATGTKICKHMVALYLTACPSEAKDFEEWQNNTYEEEYEDYDEEYYEDNYYEDDDYYDYDRRHRSDFVKPIYFDEILNSYVDKLTVEELKVTLIDELKRDEERTFNYYLQKEYKKFINDKSNIHSTLDKINTRLKELTINFDYNYKNYNATLLTNSEKKQINDNYFKSGKLALTIDKLLLNPELATYNNYKWIANFYKNNNDLELIESYTKKLTSFFDTLKHYSIKNTIPKSNVLISLRILNDYNLDTIADSLIKNSKYQEYIEYVVEHTKETSKLYEILTNKLDTLKYYDKEFIPDVIFKFVLKTDFNRNIYNDYLYYSFLSTPSIDYLDQIKEYGDINYYINKIKKHTKDILVLETLYIFLDDKKSLFNLLYNTNSDYRLIAHIPNLVDGYKEELHTYFKNRFYELLNIEKSRVIYHQAAIYVKAIYKLDKQLGNNLIEELKNSEYKKRTALFDEINRAIKENC